MKSFIKVFISHSSKDKWAARRIRNDLEAVGCTTFLDEREISTGDSIDASIQSHLSECDDFLLLLSPASAKSEWVLMELGGAIALGRRIIPILLYVSANEAPQAINLKLARDINEIDCYYDEIAVRLGKKVKADSTCLDIRSYDKSVAFRKGTVVTIARTRQSDHYQLTKSVAWVNEMNQYRGMTARIADTIASGIVKLDIDGGW